VEEPAEQRRGRPRSERARQAILSAAAELLFEQGLNSMSMDGVADRAGVSKATIYRWWPSKEVLALDAFVTDWEATSPTASPDRGSLRADLHARLRPFWRLVRKRPVGRVLTGLIARAHTDPQFALLYHERFLQPRRAATRVLFERAIRRGEIPADTNVDLALDLVYGALFHRIIQGHAPLEETFRHEVIETVVVGLEQSTIFKQREI
jgi:AcrR family transcriptional regulator